MQTTEVFQKAAGMEKAQYLRQRIFVHLHHRRISGLSLEQIYQKATARNIMTKPVIQLSFPAISTFSRYLNEATTAFSDTVQETFQDDHASLQRDVLENDDAVDEIKRAIHLRKMIVR